MYHIHLIAQIVTYIIGVVNVSDIYLIVQIDILVITLTILAVLYLQLQLSINFSLQRNKRIPTFLTLN